MNRPSAPFALPKTLASKLGEVGRYWKGLKRGGNDIPFSDDLRLTALPDIAPALLVVDVFTAPQRFRLSVVGDDWRAEGPDLAGRFLDEIQPGPNLEFLQSQCAATIESGKPTWYGPRAVSRTTAAAPIYERLLLPMWGEGYINMVLGVIEPHASHRAKR